MLTDGAGLPDHPEAFVGTALALALEAKDPYTCQHSERVACYAAVIARRLGFGEEHVRRVRTAGVLHDVGKLAVPDAILVSKDVLSNEQFERMKSHSAAGGRLVERAGMPHLARWVRAHHERFDGRGYPDGLAAYGIPLEGRILAVADSFEAMISDRCYRSAMSAEDALAELDRCAGSQFDPLLVDHMTEAFLPHSNRLFRGAGAVSSRFQRTGELVRNSLQGVRLARLSERGRKLTR